MSQSCAADNPEKKKNFWFSRRAPREDKIVDSSVELVALIPVNSNSRFWHLWCEAPNSSFYDMKL